MIINVNRRPRVQHPRDASFSQHHHCRCETDPILLIYLIKKYTKIDSAILLICSYFLFCHFWYTLVHIWLYYSSFFAEQTQVLTKFTIYAKLNMAQKLLFPSPPFSKLIYPSSVKPELCEARSGNWDISRWDFLDNVHEKLLKLKNVWICREF